MKKVEMLVDGCPAWVDVDMVKKLIKKEELFTEIISLQKYYEADKLEHSFVLPMLRKKFDKINRLRSKIRSSAVELI